jgi:hypothetical protein
MPGLNETGYRRAEDALMSGLSETGYRRAEDA